MEELDESIRESIAPFFKPDRRASSDLLNDLQRAFVKYHANTICINKESITTILIDQIIEEGVQHRIWAEDFSVGDGNDFSTYLLNRVKNEKKQLAKKRTLIGQHDMMSEYTCMASNIKKSLQCHDDLPALPSLSD